MESSPRTCETRQLKESPFSKFNRLSILIGPMIDPSMFATVVFVLVLLKCGAEFCLERLNRNHVGAHSSVVPKAFRGLMDDATYGKSVQYTLAKSRLNQFESFYDAAVLLGALFGGGLPWAFTACEAAFGASAWSMGLFVFGAVLALSLTGLPFDWYAQFHLEDRFGFNTTTARLWWTDRLKGLLLAVVLAYPLTVLILKLVEWTGTHWWLWAWGTVLAFQLLMIVLAPTLILPLFNRFSPLPEGSLRNRLQALAERLKFPLQRIEVMDGSKRSRHSNAFFTGFGRTRKVVLFDTLAQQLTEAEMEAVLAHEIGHYKKGHVPKMLIWNATCLLIGFYAVAWLASRPWFLQAFGFAPGPIAPALLLFVLLAGVLTFWLSPVVNAFSRRYEFEADTFAARALGDAEPLIGALRKLNEKNLSNLTPHPLYSRFYYSHPALLEREAALS